jgi:hypothetical protein
MLKALAEVSNFTVSVHSWKLPDFHFAAMPDAVEVMCYFDAAFRLIQKLARCDWLEHNSG